MVAAVGLSRTTLRKMHQNLWWAVGYNVIAFPFVAGVLPIIVSPEMAALVMSGNSLIVAANALLLKRATIQGLTGKFCSKPQ